MAPVNLVSGSSQPSAQLDITPMKEVKTPEVQKISDELNAKGRKEIGDESLEKALENLNRLFKENDVNVSIGLDSQSGIKQVSLTDKESGKKIAEMPPQAVVEMADKAKQQSIGWILDKYK